MTTYLAKKSDSQIDAQLTMLPHWRRYGNTIRRELKFKDFVAAFRFMTKVAVLAQEMNHHPDWSNVYNKVTINLTTHDIGGISDLDIELASKIDALA